MFDAACWDECDGCGRQMLFPSLQTVRIAPRRSPSVLSIHRGRAPVTIDGRPSTGARRPVADTSQQGNRSVRKPRSEHPVLSVRLAAHLLHHPYRLSSTLAHRSSRSCVVLVRHGSSIHGPSDICFFPAGVCIRGSRQLRSWGRHQRGPDRIGARRHRCGRRAQVGECEPVHRAVHTLRWDAPGRRRGAERNECHMRFV
mgnify:CR=1 FL=1